MNYEERYNNLVGWIDLLSHTALTSDQHQIVDIILQKAYEQEESEEERRIAGIINYHRIVMDAQKRALNDSYLQEKIENFTNAHKGEDPEDIIAACRGYETLEAKEVDDPSAPTDNCRWRILKDKEAEKYNLQLIKIDEDKALLSIDLAYIPKNMSIVEYLNWLRETGVILNFTPKTTRS